ncbi:MAG: isochorismate synthase [Flavobacteriales bacterium Tduv]
MKQIDRSELYKKALEAYRTQRKFTLFRKPEDDILQLYIDEQEQSSSRNHFLIGSFNHDHIIRIHPNQIFYTKTTSHSKCMTKVKAAKPRLQENPSDEYTEMIKITLKLFCSNSLKKIVLSRVKRIPFRKFALKTSFENLLRTHPESFVNLWNDPDHGLWMGATPELLFKTKNKKLRSVALAGTLSLDDSATTWTFKELEEHHMVIKNISNILENYLGKTSIERTKTLITGRLRHLQTPIEGSFSETPDLQSLLHALHPTPAICGLPRKSALDFILKHEGYDRTFYTGYMGPIYKDNAELYVNLRCAKIFREEIALYVGSGVTAQSNPEKEWIEAENKAQNTLSQLCFR